MAIARSISQCYPKHIRVSDGRFDEVTNSAAYRVLKNPNDYQTTPDFLLNLVAHTLTEGEAYAVAVRNSRNEITALHPIPRGNCTPMIDDQTGSVFYAVSKTPLVPGVEVSYVAPARDVLALRFHTPDHPLVGRSPLTAAALAIGINVALSRTQAAFFSNMNRPSGILSTDQVLNREQLITLRAAFDDQSKGMASGKIPVLAGGLKFNPISISSQDAQLVEAQRMSVEDICRVFGVPPPLVGDLSHATLNNAESLVQHFLSMSLGSYLEHIERAFDRIFALDGGREYVELDTSALLRTDFAGRVDGLTKAVTQGLMTPNEARSREGLGPIESGDNLFMQRQNTPINLLEQLAVSDLKASNKPAPAPTPAAPVPEPATLKDADTEITKALVINMRERARNKYVA
jgi:HK97 family phage portal protein